HAADVNDSADDNGEYQRSDNQDNEPPRFLRSGMAFDHGFRAGDRNCRRTTQWGAFKRLVDKADAAEGPEDELGFAYDAVAGEGAPEAAVVAVVAVIAHHEEFIRTELQRAVYREGGAGAGDHVRLDV